MAMMRRWTAADAGNGLMVVGSGVGLLFSLYNNFNSGNGIHGTPGALLVIVSSALVLIASLLLAFNVFRPRWLRIVVDVLLILGILGTGFAAYMLEANWLVALMVVALIGWLVHVFSGRLRPRPVAVETEVAS
jgi:hypothetical protein